jgi:UDP-GlcNAc3NAcA epimerase
MKICTIVGARPQFIKAATVSRILAKHPTLEERIIHTGQHYDSNMSALFFEELCIPTPHYQLQVGSSSHGKQTGQMLEGIETILQSEKPDCVLIYGDTNSTLAGALASAKLHIPLAHVEAGLRSFNRKMPEEINRITADHISTILFAPTDHGYQQLLKEGISKENIFQVGDVMYDATLFYNQYNNQRQTLVQTLGLSPKSYSLATIHRAENTDSLTRLKNICNALLELAITTKIVLPLHPRTRNTLHTLQLLDSLEKNLHILEPVGYLDMLALEQQASCIITDSGGVQKEAYFNGIPCITLRDETEWVELVETGWNTLCSPETAFSLNHILSEAIHSIPLQTTPLYGNGNAAEKIVQILQETV